MRYCRIFSSACIALASFMLTEQALAACKFASNYEKEGGISGWPTRVENSADAKLRTAFQNGTCEYRKGEHGGGMVPPGAPSDKHVTVKITSEGPQCHVFKKQSNLPAGAYNPTTCL